MSAGPFTEQLSRCLVTSTSVGDRNDLVRWMFSAAAKHPAVKDLVNVTPEILENSNKKMGELMTRLLTVSCLKETKEALKYEGNATIEASFNALGQVAGKEMFSHPQVAEGMSNLEKYIDTETINKLIK
ncbi:hypothetical protein JQC92_18985 [Shewanella sp. 202IG2-18]|uniref:hypothetical protein n=1 Tax=Parashewanella hymeniacidonis TaxID=2807618 RepID=UPI001961BED5|nr:hypothetical protein [Parashewanella hymeniacidonis]MBM7074092.1 hypothetical protein [Parashewanella hymeniacidonis]